MASWGTKRRNIIIFIFLSIVIITSAIFIFFFFYEEPTCFDGKQNGRETGIDCGGDCELLCSVDTVEPVVHWRRFFEIGSGFYNVIAYVENQNPAAGAVNAQYIFKLYDQNNVILTEKTGFIDLKANQVTPIVENNLNTGRLKAARVSFEFVDKIDWLKQEPVGNLVSIRNQNLEQPEGLPRITATVFNNTLGFLQNIRFIIIVFDANNNAIATSNTIISRLEKDQNQNIIFTWPIPFPSPATRFEIIPIYDLGN